MVLQHCIFPPPECCDQDLCSGATSSCVALCVALWNSPMAQVTGSCQHITLLILSPDQCSSVRDCLAIASSFLPNFIHFLPIFVQFLANLNLIGNRFNFLLFYPHSAPKARGMSVSFSSDLSRRVRAADVLAAQPPITAIIMITLLP